MHDSSFHRILLAVVISSFLGCSEKKPGPTTQDQKESDCNGVAGGSAITDNCGDCIGGSTGQSACVQDCNETWGG
ncbi:MAG TPA: hypothetical protein EYN66_24515, partial [Myxococcales bacterium]|nr:hypothetical protein [Myxococcales bacterium]